MPDASNAKADASAASLRDHPYVRELEQRLKMACEPCAECGHIDWRELDDILDGEPITRYSHLFASGEETMLVYDDGKLLHFPGPNPGTPYTVCGLDAGAMKREERPVTWAGIWCTKCMKEATIRV